MAEIRRENQLRLVVYQFSPLFIGFQHHPRWLARSVYPIIHRVSAPSQRVVFSPDFSHQQELDPVTLQERSLRTSWSVDIPCLGGRVDQLLLSWEPKVPPPKGPHPPQEIAGPNSRPY